MGGGRSTAATARGEVSWSTSASAALGVVEQRQSLRIRTEPVEQVNAHPAEDDRRCDAPREAARRGDERRLRHTDGWTGAPRPADQVVALHQCHRPHAADGVERRAAHEDPAVAIVEAEPPYECVESGQPPREAVFPIEKEAEVTADHLR